MYPSPHEQGKYASEGHPAGAVPDATQGRHYPPPPSISLNMRGQVPGVARPWSTGLCHCCDDPANCLITCFCPCITFGQIAEMVGRGSPSCAENGVCYGLLGLTGFACLFSCFYRSKLRAQYDLDEAPCVDCLVHFFCEACALCQEYRELKNRGFDMGIGWEANIDRQNRGMTAAPTVEGGMRR